MLASLTTVCIVMAPPWGLPPRGERAPLEQATEPGRVRQALGTDVVGSARIGKLVQKLAGHGLEPLHVLVRHLRSPIPKSRRGRQPRVLRIESGLPPHATLVKPEHGVVVPHA